MEYVIIVAGGKGLRMGSELPKQFMPIGGKPVLMYTIEQFLKYSPDINIIVVLPRNQQEFWNKLCEEHNFNIPHTIADGGESRFESSKNGLSLILDNEQGVVAFHDGVRPFVSIDVIERCFDAARDDYAAIPVMPVTDTLRYVDRGHGHNVERNNFRSVQTPQVFDISLAKQAFDQPYRPSFTDDATVIESLGCQVSMVEGNRENIKLTTPFDLQLAELLIHHS